MRRGFHRLETKSAQPLEVRLRRIYPDLSSSYEKLQVVHDHLSSPKEIAVATILEDDLLSLIEECEDYLMRLADIRYEQVRSLESRTVTVLEELKALRCFSKREAPRFPNAVH